MKRRSFMKNSTAAAAMTLSGMLSTSQAQSSNENEKLNPFMASASLENARHAPGLLMHFLVTKEQTNGAFSLIEAKAVPGMEPPMHWHEHEDEAFYMLDGHMIVTVGEKEYEMKKGDYVFLPRGIPHTQKILSEQIHVLLTISPSGLDQLFWDISQPAEQLIIPPIMTEPPSAEMIEMMMAMNRKYGIHNV